MVKINFLLTRQNINERKGYKNEQNDHLKKIKGFFEILHKNVPSHHYFVDVWAERVNDDFTSHVVQSSLDEAKDADSNGTKRQGAHV